MHDPIYCKKVNSENGSNLAQAATS